MGFRAWVWIIFGLVCAEPLEAQTPPAWTLSPIGTPAQPATLAPAAGGIDLASVATGASGTADQLDFAWIARTGNFDVRVQVSSLTVTDPWAQAGLMMRENLTPGGRQVSVLAAPGSVGSLFYARTTQGGAITQGAGFPVNYPDTWLRLRRSGTTFNGYASLDGVNWTLLGTANISVTNVHLGLAVASRATSSPAIAQFRGYGDVVGGNLGNFRPNREPLGPSSRRTDLVISEIHFHPRARSDGRVLEFVELHNAGLTFEDLSGHRLAGSIEYAFPAGTVLGAGDFLVVARTPADLQAAGGLTGGRLFGPYQGALENGSGQVRLENEHGAVLLEAAYGSGPGWPAAADGGGHSLVLARPSYGESDVRAWNASARVGGSPGGPDPILAGPLETVVLNEFLAHTDDPQLDFIELYNRSNVAVDVSGCVLTDDATTNRFRIPAGTSIAPRGYLVYDQNALGFALDARGEFLYLIDPAGTRVVDALRFEAQANGISSGRAPDGAPSIRPLETPTAGAPNRAWRQGEVVINEIYFNPISGDDDDEFVELFNRTSSAVSLAGWRFTDGIDYRFPTNATIAPRGYAVVTRDRDRMLARYPQLAAATVFGNYAGTLSNSGERLALARPDAIARTNNLGEVVQELVHIVVNEVTYAQGGRWERYADGGGSSLELIDPEGDTWRPSNWADSDETAKAPWGLIEFAGRLDLGNSAYPPNSLQILAQGAGEFLIDAVEVIGTNNVNVVTNGGFDLALTNWFFQGNHSRTAIDPAGGYGDNGPCLHVRAGGRGDTGANRIRTSIPSGLAVNRDARIRARVRWLAGHPEALLRLRGNWLEAYGQMPLPTNPGTPGARNSRAVANAGPAIFDVTHTPAVPAVNEAVLVTARLSDPQGIGRATLRYRVDPAATVLSLPLGDDGTGGDAVAGDGLYSALLSGRTAGTLIAFWVDAADAAGTPANALFPADAPVRECLVRWGETVHTGNIPTYRFWNTAATLRAWSGNGGGLNNTFQDGTFVYGGHRVIYNMGVHDKGSPFHGGRGDYFVVMPDDDPLLGETDLALVSTGNAGDEPTAQREQAAHWIGRQLGAPGLHRRFIHLYVNGSRHRAISEDAQEPNARMAGSWYGEDGDLYKIEDWFEFPDSLGNFGSVDATLERFVTTGSALKQARYRWSWRKRAVRTSANDYSSLLALVEAVNAPNNSFTARVEDAVDVEGWMRTFALQHIVGNWDAYGYNRGKNAYTYRPPNGRWQMIPWDIDFVLGSGSDNATTDIFSANDPVVRRMYSHPPFRRVYLRAMQDAVAGPLTADAILPRMEAKYRALLANGIQVQSPSQIMTYVNARRTYLTGRIAEGNAPFAILNNAGNDFSTNRNVATLAGTAPLAVAEIEVNGTRYDVNWTSVTNWTLALPLPGRDNLLTLRGLDRFGRPLDAFTDSVRVTYTGTPVTPAGAIVFSEIMYNPAAPDASYVELFNTSASATFDLSNWRIDGLGFNFAEGTLIGPRAFIVVARNRDGFTAAYGLSIVPVGEFPGSLDNGGETLRLVQPGATAGQDVVIDEVRYDDDPPWPGTADGFGPSLQLIDPNTDNNRAGNWAATATNAPVRFTPGAANSVFNILDPFPPIWINEVLPANIGGATDAAGDRDPWIELHNAGTTAVDVSGYYLSDHHTNLTRWRFPAGTSVPAGGFLLVWADAEPAESSATQPHTDFRIAPSTGRILLSRLQFGAPAVMDYLDYDLLPAGRSYGSPTDGTAFGRRTLHFPTAAAPNNPAAAPIPVVLNEWMAGNTRTVLDPADDDFDDWFELFNPGNTEVDLGGYFLTDTLTNATKFAIPNGVRIAPGGFLRVWADEEIGQNGRTPDLHVNFRLALEGEELGLFAPDGSIVDSLRMPQQTNDVSQGRFPDGAPAPFLFLELATPGTHNLIPGGNQPPVLANLGPQTATEGSPLVFRATATDPENHAITFALGSGAPAGASIDAATGLFAWTPAEADGPNTFAITIVARDAGSPPRTDSEVVPITVGESNRAPALLPIADQAVNELEPLVFILEAADPDLPANQLTFALETNAPDGMTVAPDSGELRWTPPESAGGQTFVVGVRVTDNGQPALSRSAEFRVRVAEIDNPPLFEPVFAQTLDEGSTLRLQLRAEDPDSPASAVSYTLDSPVPPGATLDSATGLLLWQTRESDGPSTNIFTVHATELAGQKLSGSFTFAVFVEELNTAPSLAPVPDITLTEGEPIELTLTALDPDLPAQKLVFGLLQPGAPPGLTLDPTTGILRWEAPEETTALQHEIAVVVRDDGAPPLASTNRFRIAVQPRWKAVISEILPKPTTAGTEFVELANTSTTRPYDLSGLVLAGDSLRFIFPAGTSLAPGATVVVVRDRAAFAATYGSGRPIAGNWTGTLGATTDTLRLLRATTGGTGENVLDAVHYNLASPWPAAAAQGAALQLVDARRDNARVGNWEATSGVPVGFVPLVVTLTNQWRYEQSGTDLGSAWREPGFNDTAWPQGPALLYVENAALPVAKNTALTIGRTTYYFRTRFQYPGSAASAQLKLRYILDDGAVFYLNGREILRFNMPEGDIAFDTFAPEVIGDAALSEEILLPPDGLRSGENVLAVEVHQVNAGSSDIVFGASLEIVGANLAPATPGAANSIAQPLAEFPPVWINEIQPRNPDGARDNTGEPSPWLELYNAGRAPVSLAGWWLTTDFATLTQWPFPAGTVIEAGEFMRIWLDGEPQETAPGHLHAGIATRLATGSIALVMPQGNTPRIADYLLYDQPVATGSFGNTTDGDPFLRQVFSTPTPGAANASGPVPPTELPPLTARLGPAGDVEIVLPGVGLGRYRLLHAPDLTQPTWTVLGELPATPAEVRFSPNTTQAPRGFYRVDWMP